MSEDHDSLSCSRPNMIDIDNNEDTEPSIVKSDKIDKMWQCEVCMMVNKSKRKKCSICNALQPASMSESSLSPNKKETLSPRSSKERTRVALKAVEATENKVNGNEWSCPACTFTNSIDSKVCARCGSKLGTTRSKNATRSNGNMDSEDHQEQQADEFHPSHGCDDNEEDDDDSMEEEEEGIGDSSSSSASQSSHVYDDHNRIDSDGEDDNVEDEESDHENEGNDDLPVISSFQHENNIPHIKLEDDQSQEEETTSDTWKCPQCTYINAIGFKYCDVCGCQTPVKSSKVYLNKAVRTQLRLQKTQRAATATVKSRRGSSSAKKPLRIESAGKIKREKVEAQSNEKEEQDDSSHDNTNENDNESIASQSRDNTKGVKRRRANSDSDYISLSKKRQRKKASLRRNDISNTNDVKNEKSSSSHNNNTQQSKEERIKEMKAIYETQFDSPPPMKRGMAIIWNCQGCSMVNRLKDVICAKCSEKQEPPYRYCALCTYFKAIEHRKAKRLAAEEAAAAAGDNLKNENNYKFNSSQPPANLSRRTLLSAEYRRARDTAANNNNEAVVLQFNREPKVGPDYQIDPDSLPQPCRFIRTSLDYSLYHDRFEQHLHGLDVDEISPWEHTNDWYEVLWIPPPCDDDGKQWDFDAYLPKQQQFADAADTTDKGEEVEKQVDEILMDVIEHVIDHTVDDRSTMFKKYPVLAMQCLLQCRYDLQLATDMMSAMIKKYGEKGLDPQLISMNEEQLNTFEEAMIVHGNENWNIVKNEFPGIFNVAQLQDFYHIVWCHQHRDRSIEADRQHRIYSRMSAASRQRRLKNKLRQNSAVEEERRDEETEKSSHSSNDLALEENGAPNRENKDEEDNYQELDDDDEEEEDLDDLYEEADAILSTDNHGVNDLPSGTALTTADHSEPMDIDNIISNEVEVTRSNDSAEHSSSADIDVVMISATQAVSSSVPSVYHHSCSKSPLEMHVADEEVAAMDTSD